MEERKDLRGLIRPTIIRNSTPYSSLEANSPISNSFMYDIETDDSFNTKDLIFLPNFYNLSDINRVIAPTDYAMIESGLSRGEYEPPLLICYLLRSSASKSNILYLSYYDNRRQIFLFNLFWKYISIYSPQAIS